MSDMLLHTTHGSSSPSLQYLLHTDSDGFLLLLSILSSSFLSLCLAMSPIQKVFCPLCLSFGISSGSGQVCVKVFEYLHSDSLVVSGLYIAETHMHPSQFITSWLYHYLLSFIVSQSTRMYYGNYFCEGFLMVNQKRRAIFFHFRLKRHVLFDVIFYPTNHIFSINMRKEFNPKRFRSTILFAFNFIYFLD